MDHKNLFSIGEIAKAVGIYSIPIAAPAGGVYLYRKHKKKKSEEKSDDK